VAEVVVVQERRFRLTFTRSAWAELMGGLLRSPDEPRLGTAGINRDEWRTELLVASAAAPVGLPARLRVVAAERAGELAERLRIAISAAGSEEPQAVLAVGIGRATGHLAGALLDRGQVKPLGWVRLLAAGLPEVAVGGPPGVVVSRLPVTGAEREVWSRSIGALGEVGWRRLMSLHTIIIGCGRSGSLAATALARIGVRRLTLVDPDRLETHNMGEMDLVRAVQRGDFKVYAVAEELERLQENIAGESASRLRVTPIAESVSSLRALEAVKRADLLIACVDDEAARLAAAVLAKLYLKPLLDIGTGVFEAPGNGRQIGADIRLVMPDECLLCVGGLNDLAGARIRLATESGELRTADWQRQRAGSLRSLNMLAVGLGLRLVEELAAGRLGESAWVRVEFDARGLPQLEQRRITPQSACPLCHFAGWGDEGLQRAVSGLIGAARPLEGLLGNRDPLGKGAGETQPLRTPDDRDVPSTSALLQ